MQSYIVKAKYVHTDGLPMIHSHSVNLQMAYTVIEPHLHLHVQAVILQAVFIITIHHNVYGGRSVPK